MWGLFCSSSPTQNAPSVEVLSETSTYRVLLRAQRVVVSGASAVMVKEVSNRFAPSLTHRPCRSSLQHGSKVFAYFYGMFNIYVLLLAFCYTPAGSIYGDINTNDNVRTCQQWFIFVKIAPCTTFAPNSYYSDYHACPNPTFVRVGNQSHVKLEMVAEDKQGVPSYKDDTAFTIVESSNQHTML